MTREIKFRAWDRYNHIMLENFQQDKFFADKLNDDFYSVMQFTGLHDKNGKEIYEGDLVQGHVSNERHWTVPPIERQKYIVVWRGGKFHIDSREGKEGWVLNWHVSSEPSELEVIGNIYENPELLKI